MPKRKPAHMRDDTRESELAAVSQTPEMRRHCSTLAISGAGVIVFSVWGIVKSLLSSALGTAEPDPAQEEELLETLQLSTERMNEQLGVYALIVVGVLVVSVVLFFVHIYIGRAALAQSRGEQRSAWYVVLAGLTLVCNMASSVAGVVLFGRLYAPDELAVSLIIDATSAVMLIDLISSALKLRRLTRQAAGEEE